MTDANKYWIRDVASECDAQNRITSRCVVSKFGRTVYTWFYFFVLARIPWVGRLKYFGTDQSSGVLGEVNTGVTTSLGFCGIVVGQLGGYWRRIVFCSD